MLSDTHEQTAKAQGHTVCGVDEVGRGPLAGPVVAAAVIVPPTPHLRSYLLSQAGDSKILTAKRREALAPFIHEHCTVSIAEASVQEIDHLNIRKATHLAMTRAVQGLTTHATGRGFGGEAPNASGVILAKAGIHGLSQRVALPYCLIDGNDRPPTLQGHTIIKGDAIELAIACASIVAKVHRDALMTDLHQTHPHYGWNTNAGYGSATHLKALQTHGPTPHHRQSFAPVREILERAKVAA